MTKRELGKLLEMLRRSSVAENDNADDAWRAADTFNGGSVW